MLVDMRDRGAIDIGLQTMLTECGVDIGVNEKAFNINKEKMSAEFKDCHLYLTYLRLGYTKFKLSMCMPVCVCNIHMHMHIHSHLTHTYTTLDTWCNLTHMHMHRLFKRI